MSATTLSIRTNPSPAGASTATDPDLGACVAIKASGGQIYSIHIDNVDSAQDAYIQVFDKAASGVALGTDIPEVVVWCPAGKDITYAFRDITNNAGLNVFGTAIAAACTTTPNGSTLLTVMPTVNIDFT